MTKNQSDTQTNYTKEMCNFYSFLTKDANIFGKLFVAIGTSWLFLFTIACDVLQFLATKKKRKGKK